VIYMVLVGLCGGAPTLALASGFKVSSVQPRASGQTLHLSGSMDLTLTPEVEEAIGNGIPVEIALDFRLYRDRALIWDERVASWTLRRELRYHALTGQYLINAAPGGPVARESFTSINEALAQTGSLTDVTLPLIAPLLSGAEYYLSVRASLDIEALPALLRPLAYTSRAWDLNSGWTTWKAQR
jgi:hypothetical protein